MILDPAVSSRDVAQATYASHTYHFIYICICTYIHIYITIKKAKRSKINFINTF